MLILPDEELLHSVLLAVCLLVGGASFCVGPFHWHNVHQLESQLCIMSSTQTKWTCSFKYESVGVYISITYIGCVYTKHRDSLFQAHRTPYTVLVWSISQIAIYRMAAAVYIVTRFQCIIQGWLCEIDL